MPGGMLDVQIDAGIRGAIRGTVISQEDHPVAGVEVRAYPEFWNGGRPLWSQGRTDEAGSFEVSNLLSEPHRLVAVRWTRLDGMVFDLGSEPATGVFPGESAHRLVLPTPGAVVLTVHDADGGPVRDLDVYLDSDRHYPFDVESQVEGVPAVTVRVKDSQIVVDDPIADRVPCSPRLRDDRLRLDGKGQFRIPRIRPGPVRFVVDDIRSLPTHTEVTVEPGRTVQATLRVVHRGRLDVTVRDRAGHPLAGAQVVVVTAEGHPVPVLVQPNVMSSTGGPYREATAKELVLGQVRTDTAGRTMRRYLDPGTYRLRVAKDRFSPRELPLVVSAGGHLEPRVVLSSAD
jgi:hypothetical protein